MKHYPRSLLDYRLFRKAKITWKMLIIYISKCCTVIFIHLLLIQVLICYGKRQKYKENLWKKSFWAIIILFKKLKQSEIYAACSSLYKQHWDQFRCMSSLWPFVNFGIGIGIGIANGLKLILQTPLLPVS